MNTLSNFSDFALTRGEMKSVSGGGCFVRGAGPNGTNLPITGGNAANVAQQMAQQENTNWCCDGCSGASWCQKGRC